MASVKKSVKSKEWPRNGCDGIGRWQNFNSNNSGQFVLLHPQLHEESAQNSPQLLLLKFCYQPIPSQPFLGCPLISQLFFYTDHFKQGRTFFYSQAVFE